MLASVQRIKNHQLVGDDQLKFWLSCSILLMEEILHHLTCMKPCKSWDIYHINWLSGFFSSTVFLQGWLIDWVRSCPLRRTPAASRRAAAEPKLLVWGFAASSRTWKALEWRHFASPVCVIDNGCSVHIYRNIKMFMYMIKVYIYDKALTRPNFLGGWHCGVPLNFHDLGYTKGFCFLIHDDKWCFHAVVTSGGIWPWKRPTPTQMTANYSRV